MIKADAIDLPFEGEFFDGAEISKLHCYRIEKEIVYIMFRNGDRLVCIQKYWIS